jgi:hypothetical protein
VGVQVGNADGLGGGGEGFTEGRDPQRRGGVEPGEDQIVGSASGDVTPQVVNEEPGERDFASFVGLGG